MPTHLLAIDEGTTGVRAFVMDETGRVVADGHRELPQHFPRPGWVEHDAEEIWAATLGACRQALRDGGVGPDRIRCIGITNQRETTLVWDRDTLEPIHRAIVWQDRRTASICDALTDAGHADTVRETTGLVIDPYFSGTKVQWLLDEVPSARQRAEAGTLAFGTIDSWLVARMTAGREHVTEPSNASRTMLYDLNSHRWSPEMLELLGVPASVLPEVRDSVGHFGTTDPEAFLGIRAPISGIAGDQQAALFGQGAWTAGMSKNTYGTGSFLLFNTGDVPVHSESGLLTSVGWQIDGVATYVLEGAIFVTGASVQWLRDELGIISSAEETAALAAQLPPGNEGVYLVPAFAGLGAPHWDPYARAAILGLTRGCDRRHLARAALEAMAYQTLDVVELMERDASQRLSELRVDGGAAANDVLCQFQADLLGVPVVRPRNTETTVLGAAFLAGLGSGTWSSTDDVSRVWRVDREFTPDAPDDLRERLMAGWHAAVERSLGWTQLTGRI